MTQTKSVVHAPAMSVWTWNYLNNMKTYQLPVTVILNIKACSPEAAEQKIRKKMRSQVKGMLFNVVQEDFDLMTENGNAILKPEDN